VIYSELSIAFARIEELEKVVADTRLAFEACGCEALVVQGQAS
jgi:hypothetical protein